MNTITSGNLKKIIKYQKECDGKAAVTTTAAFSLEAIEELIKHIRGSAEYKKYEKLKKKPYKPGSPVPNTFYHICVTFIREKIDEIKGNVTPNIFLKDDAGQVKEYGKKKCDGYTQLIPIITGCVCELDDAKGYPVKKFKHLQKNGSISFVAPGGEGSGLRPPPPTA
ncbi:MAG: hypothetical protein SFU87_01150 [Chitinophagaceae bacterium]|nr:hypothetical protein [Chitinophagaceae bacterium]